MNGVLLKHLPLNVHLEPLSLFYTTAFRSYFISFSVLSSPESKRQLFTGNSTFRDRSPAVTTEELGERSVCHIRRQIASKDEAFNAPLPHNNTCARGDESIWGGAKAQGGLQMHRRCSVQSQSQRTMQGTVPGSHFKPQSSKDWGLH